MPNKIFLLSCILLFSASSAWAIDPFLPQLPSDPVQIAPSQPPPKFTGPDVIQRPDFTVCDKWIQLAAVVGWAAVSSDYTKCVGGVIADYKFPVPLFVPTDPWQP